MAAGVPEGGGGVAPAALLDAADRDRGPGLGRRQHGGVQHPVLLGPPQLLPFEEQDQGIRLVADDQGGDRPRSLNSSTVTEPAASASSASRYSVALLVGLYSGNTARASCRRG